MFLSFASVRNESVMLEQMKREVWNSGTYDWMMMMNKSYIEIRRILYKKKTLTYSRCWAVGSSPPPGTPAPSSSPSR